MSGGGRQLGGRVDFCNGVDDLRADSDAPTPPRSEASPLASSYVVGPALGGSGSGVGEGRGVGVKVARAKSPNSRSADGEFLLEDVTPPSKPSITCACVGEELGKEARVVGVGAGASVEDAGSADAGSADVGSTVATSKGARARRLASHKQAGPSPRCAWGWLEKQLEKMKAIILEDTEDPEALTVAWSVEVSRPAVRHIVGRRGKTLQRIEDLCGVFVALQDMGEEHSEVLLWGSAEGVALAEFVVHALGKGMHSILDSFCRLGF